MNVGELIVKLKEVNQEAEVFIWNYAHGEYETFRGGIIIEWNDDFDVIGCMLK